MPYGILCIIHCKKGGLYEEKNFNSDDATAFNDG